MSWYSYAKAEISEEELNKKLKEIIKTQPLFQQLMCQYHIPASKVDDGLKIVIKDMDKKHGEADSETIYLNTRLFDDGDFFENKLLFFVHEFFHWIKRNAEKQFYLNDPEEIQSFTLSMMWELLRGKDKAYVEQVVYPIIFGHFEDEAEARKMCDRMFEKAVLLVKQFSK